MFECLLLVAYGCSLLIFEFGCQDPCALASMFSCVVCAIMGDTDMNLVEEVENDYLQETQLTAETTNPNGTKLNHLLHDMHYPIICLDMKR